MKNNYFLVVLLLSMVFSIDSFAQTTVKFQDFEGGSDDWNYTISPASYNVSGDVWSNVTSVGGTVSGAQNGGNFWGMRDLENSNGGGAFDHTITFDNVDVSATNGATISFFYITEGFDTTDYLRVEIFHDDVSQGVTELNKSTNAWTEFTAAVPNTVNNVRATIIARQNGAGDYAGVDNFKIIEASTDPSVGFDSDVSIENETNSTFNTSIPVSFTNYTSDVTVSVTVDASSTAQVGDYTLNTSSLSFTSNGTQNISLDINDDADFISETVVLNIAVTSGTADVITAQHTVTIVDNDTPIVINEIHADPDATNGDANGDGTINTSQDEFVEIYNISGASLDISGWVIADASGDRHVFPGKTVIPANEAIVVFGGGTAVTVPGLVQYASAGFLGLNNGGDTITIKDANGITIISEVYGSEGGDNQAIAREDDLSGSFVKHSTIATNPVLFSPGRDNTDNTSFSSTFKWTGATDNNWNTASNWLNGSVPGATSEVIIPAGLTNYPTITSAIVDVAKITIYDSATLIAETTINADIEYNRSLNTTDWKLISAPLNTVSIDDIVANNNFASGTAGNIGLGFYNNNGATAWNYQINSGALDNARGMAVKLDEEVITFNGKLNTNPVSITLTTGDRTNFNLIGNPFTAYLNSTAFLNDFNNSFAFSEQTIWLWDGTQYVTRNLANPVEIGVGQGFFVSAGINNIPVSMKTTMLSHQAADTFFRTSPSSSIELFVESNNNTKGTKVFYIEGKTTGFDNGYDSKMFNGVAYDFAIYTELLSDNDGRNLAIQTLPNSDLETMVIPVGLIANAGKEITFSVNTENLPNGINVYLEDRVNNTFVNLSEENFTVTTNSASNGTGQFYIHTTAAKLSTEDISNENSNIRIYKSANQEITITGLQTKASVKVFSLLGEEVMAENLSSNQTHDIQLPNLASGVYVIQLSSSTGNITKKIILE
jgi:hypothetical protein